MPHDRREAACDPLEAALRGLRPRPTAFDRDAVFFRAGRASARPDWGWPLATAVTSLAALATAAVLIARPTPAPEVRLVYVPTDDRPSENEPAAVLVPDRLIGQPQMLEYSRLQDQVYRKGLDGLPPVPPAPDPSPPVRIEGLLDAP